MHDLYRSTLLLAGATMLASSCFADVANAAPAGVDPAQPAFFVSSSTFKDGTMMPAKVGQTNPITPGCTGPNVSPQLSWSDAPGRTKSYAMVIVGVEGQGGLGESHFVAYGIPAGVTSFAEGEITRLSGKFVGGKNIHGASVYIGPCAHPGPPRHYIFEVIATDFEPMALAPGLNWAQLQAKLAGGHAIASASLVGLFGK